MVDLLRVDAVRQLNPKTRGTLGQFMTPAVVARYMASLFGSPKGDVVLLDPGAGVGSLSAAAVQSFLGRAKSIRIDAYEIEPILTEYLATTLERCREAGSVTARIVSEDFILSGVHDLEGGLFATGGCQYTHCIMNPPYKKVGSGSKHRLALRRIGIETSNLYTAFMAIAIKKLATGGELVAIVPRSFCNGSYFRPFRGLFLSEMALRSVHLFEDRNMAFGDDDVLQENIILHAIKGAPRGRVMLTASNGSGFDDLTQREVDYEQVVLPGDADLFIRLATSEVDQMVLDRMEAFPHVLADLGLGVCTGPVVDFRLRADLRAMPEPGTCPMIYPSHAAGDRIDWPQPEGRKPNAIAITDASSKWLMPDGYYVIIRRFSAKEERRRIVASVYEPRGGDWVGFDNKVNVIHHDGAGLDNDVARGLAKFLNSTLVDMHFRQFSGHTQVNATDLRMMHFPSLALLAEYGRSDKAPDALVRGTSKEGDPLTVKQKTAEALNVLKQLGLPRAQQQERSALTLLAILDMRPETPWAEARDPLIGITPIMDFIAQHYGKTYAPNTRETIRRQTMHQFMQAGLAVANPDCPDRPINSPKWCYQVEPAALALLRHFGTDTWTYMLTTYRGKRQALTEQYAREREMSLIPLVINGGKEITLTPGDHSELIKQIIVGFGPRFAPGSEVLYVGDTGDKIGHFDAAVFATLGLTFDTHGKFPDVVLYDRDRNWLLLIESVTSHGPVDAKRHIELADLFAASTAGLVYVTAFPDRRVMGKYLAEIGWATEVWTADAPTHLIHFNGERFLGPYSEP
ncbi:MAG: BsuBI/PstI family type II restriction endonuclease [Candidatus Krumholzibacteriia bacterium]